MNSCSSRSSTFTEWFSPGRFAAILALLIAATYPEVITGRGTFFHRDFDLFGYPLAYFHREAFWQGELPLWNPLNYCGLPFMAQWNTLTFYPLSLIYLLVPLSVSLGWFCLMHLFLAGMGMYFLGRRWTENSFASAAAGVSFVFSVLMLNFLMWPNNIAAMGWMPWVILTAERACKEGGRHLVMAAITGTIQMLSGAPEVIFLTWVLAGSLATTFCLTQLRTAFTQIGRFLAVVGLTAALSALQLLPFFDLLSHSQRSSTFGDSTWAMPPLGWLNFFVPLFQSRATSLGVYSQANQYWVYSYYLGIGAVLFALLAVWFVRRKVVWILAILSVFCLWLALGENGGLFSVLRHAFPGMGFMRFPIKFVILPAFSVPLLAAFLLASRINLGPSPSAKVKKALYVIGSMLVLTVGFAILAAYQWPIPEVIAATTAKSGFSRLIFAGFFLTLLVITNRIGESRLSLWPKLGLIALLWLDPLTIGPRPNPTVSPGVYDPQLIRREIAMSSIPEPGQGRVMLRGETERNLNIAQFDDPMQSVLYSRLALFGNANLLDGIPKAIGMFSLYLREYGELLELLYHSELPPAGLADLLSISQINAPGKATEWIPRPTALPWFTAGQKPIFADRDTTLREMQAVDFNPSRTVYLPLELEKTLRTYSESNPQLLLREFKHNGLRLQVNCTEPALLVLSQCFHPNWKARLDGNQVNVLRANHAFQAVEIPAGAHELQLRYDDPMFRLGALISGTAILILTTMWYRFRPNRGSNDKSNVQAEDSG